MALVPLTLFLAYCHFEKNESPSSAYSIQLIGKIPNLGTQEQKKLIIKNIGINALTRHGESFMILVDVGNLFK